MGHTLIGVVEIKSVIQTGTAEINGYCTQRYQTKPPKNNCGQDILCSCILSGSPMDTIKNRIVTFAKTRCSCSYQEVLSPSHRLDKFVSLPVHSAWPTGATVSPPWIQCLWVFSQESPQVFFVTKLQWKCLSNSYINTQLT